MASRFTETDKWDDVWFSGLKPLSKLLFLYLCDQCDIAGLLELNSKKMCFDLGIGKQDVERSLKEIETRLIYSIDARFVFVRNFLKHQRNDKLNPSNNAHKGIIRRLEENLSLFGFKDINEFSISPSLAPSKPLDRGTGNSKGKGNVIEDSIDTKNRVERDEISIQVKKTNAAKAATLVRKEEFYKSLIPYVDQYGKDMIRAFYDYWTEMNKTQTKMRFDKQPTWEIAKRLATWANKESTYVKTTKEPELSTDGISRLHPALR